MLHRLVLTHLPLLQPQPLSKNNLSLMSQCFYTTLESSYYLPYPQFLFFPFRIPCLCSTIFYIFHSHHINSSNSILIVGLALIYAMDFFEMKLQAILIYWATLSIFWTSAYLFNFYSLLRFSFYNFLILIDGSLFILLLGVAGTLQSSTFIKFSAELAVVLYFLFLYLFVA